MRKLERCPRSKPCSIKIRFSMKQNIHFYSKPRMDLDGKWFGRPPKEQKRHFFIVPSFNQNKALRRRLLYIYHILFPHSNSTTDVQPQQPAQPWYFYHFPFLPSIFVCQTWILYLLILQRNCSETMAFWSTSGSK